VSRLRIIVGGMVGQFPLGGVAWDYFHYVLGLAELGHDVYYHERNDGWPFHPGKRYATDDPAYTIQFIADFFQRYAPHLADRWHYVLLRQKHFGMTAEAFDRVAETADLFLNVSGASFIPEKLSPKCVKVFLDTDPGFNQIVLSEKFAWAKDVEQWCNLVAAHDRHLTYAENIHGADCVIPRLGFDWRPTRCVVSLPQWEHIRQSPPPHNAAFTTVMTWDYFRGRLTFNGVEFFTKVAEFEKFDCLPHRSGFPLILAIGGVLAPLERLRAQGWRIIDAHSATLTPHEYQQFIGDSGAEWSVAKNIYVATRSGWFSCRTACYLAAGRPAVVQDTAWSKFIPAGRGLLAFNTLDEAIEGLKAVADDPLPHRAAAYEIARNYLAADKVLPPMLDTIFSRS